MFREVISNSPLFNDVVNDFFSNIYGGSYNNDISFVSTLRALVAPRMKTDEKLCVNFFRTKYSASDVRNMSTASAIRNICEHFDTNEAGSIYINSFDHIDQNSNYACLELVKSSFCKVYPGWYRLEKVTEFYRKQFLTMCFINPERRSVAIFIDSMGMREMHYLQCSIFAFLPWYFDPKNGVSELEMELINSLRERTSEKYKNAIAKIAEKYDFRTAKIRQLLSGFETRYEEIECDRIRDRIQTTIRDIDCLNSQIGDYLRIKNDLEIKLLGLERKVQDDGGESEIMEYFLCNDKLVLTKVTDKKIEFCVKTYIEYYDEDMAMSAINNHNSYLYAPDGARCNNYIPEESMEKLMRAIFIDQILKIKVCAAYELYLDGAVNGKQYYEFGYEFQECMPNPHIDGYHCLGNYTTTINTMLKTRNYIGAIEQCIASAKSLNFGDSTVMTLFARAIYHIACGYNNKCIELPNKNVVTPKEAIDWLKEQEADNIE